MEGCDTILSELRWWWKVKHVFHHHITASSPAFTACYILHFYNTEMMIAFQFHLPRPIKQSCVEPFPEPSRISAFYYVYCQNIIVVKYVIGTFLDYKPNNYSDLTAGFRFLIDYYIKTCDCSLHEIFTLVCASGWGPELLAPYKSMGEKEYLRNNTLCVPLTALPEAFYSSFPNDNNFYLLTNSISYFLPAHSYI